MSSSPKKEGVDLFLQAEAFKGIPALRWQQEHLQLHLRFGRVVGVFCEALAKIPPKIQHLHFQGEESLTQPIADLITAALIQFLSWVPVMKRLVPNAKSAVRIVLLLEGGGSTERVQTTYQVWPSRSMNQQSCNVAILSTNH